jgi:hypothetical protein
LVMAFDPNDMDGNPTGALTEYTYESANSATNGVMTGWADDDSRGLFEQYADGEGLIRTIFNSSEREGDTDFTDDYQLLYMLVGNANYAGILSYSAREVGSTVGSAKYESYNNLGQLLSESYNGSFVYPLFTLEKSGYGLRTDGSEYWMENDGNDSYDSGTDINLTHDGLGTVIEDYDNPFVVDYVDNWCPGQYLKWVGEKEFESQPFDRYSTSTELVGLDSSAEIESIQAVLDDWVSVLEYEDKIDIAADDMLIVESLATMKADFGFTELDAADFPVLD